MHIQPHKTLIAILLQYVESWRKENGRSRQTAASLIVEAHDATNGPKTTGIEFNPPTQDAYKRVAVNCDRIYRWLDDSTKENNLLPANMIPSVIAALPPQYRVHFFNELLRPVGLAARELNTGQATPSPELLKAMMRETSEAAAAFTDLLDGATHGELIEAQRQLAEANDVVRKNLELVEGMIERSTV